MKKDNADDMVTCSHCKRVRSQKRMKPGKNNAWLCFDYMECEEMKKGQRYFVDSDESGDYYCIPVEQKDAWQEWQDSGLDTDPIPEGSFYIGGWPNEITFTDPEPKEC